MEIIARNTAWLSGEKIIRLGGGLLLSVLTAKYLGPEEFGLFNFIVAFTAFFHIVTSVGYEATLVKSFLENPETKKKILSTSIWLRFFVSILMLGLILLLVPIFKPGNESVLVLAFFFGLGFILQALENIDYWNQATQEISKTVIVRFISFLITSIFRLWLIYSEKSLVWFAISFTVESLLNSFLLLSFLKEKSGIRFLLNFDSKIASRLLKMGFPMILSLIFLSLQAKVDQLMISQYLGDKDLGLYSVAFRIYEVILFFPTALAAAAFPSLILHYSKSKPVFFEYVQSFMNFTFLCGILGSAGLYFFADPIIQYSFGIKYTQSAQLLSIIGFNLVCGFWGALVNPIILVFGKPNILLLKNFMAAVLVFTLNSFLIPKFGLKGACFTALTVSFLSNFVFNLAFSETRNLFFIQLKAIGNFATGVSFVELRDKSNLLLSANNQSK